MEEEKESRVDFLGDIEKMTNKFFLGWILSYSIFNLIIGINLFNLGRYLI